MITNQMIGAVRSVLVPKQRSEVSFSVGSTAEINTSNYFYIGHRGKKKIERGIQSPKFHRFLTKQKRVH